MNEFNFGSSTDKMKNVDLDENKRIVWDVIDSDPQWIGTTISFDLVDKNGTTEITLKQSNWKEVTDLFRWRNYNWGFFLYSLKTYCEEGKGIPTRRVNFNCRIYP